MKTLLEVLEPMDGAARERVLNWVRGRLGMEVASQPPPSLEANVATGTGSREVPPEFEDFAHLFDLAQPSDKTDQALIGCYWVSVVMSIEPFGTQVVNNELKNLGHGISDINKAFDRLKEQSPSLVRQIARKGSTKQARKEYKLTDAGKRRVQLMLSGDLV